MATTLQLPKEKYDRLLKKLTFADVLRAVADLEDSLRTGFQPAKDWQLRIAGKTFSHRPVIALATRRYCDCEMVPEHFSGPMDNACRKRLEALGFEIVKLPHS